MNKCIIAPNKYVQGSGIISNLADYYLNEGSKCAFIICDSFIEKNYKKQIVSSFEEKKVNYNLHTFNGECSKNEVDRLSSILKEKQGDVIIGIGGGKALDTSKAVAYYNKLPVIIVPTIASTDAPCSALSVLYKDNGEFDEYLFLPSNPNAVIVDTDIVAKAPVRLLVSGIGDALATYFEARACKNSNANSIAGGKTTLAAMAIAKLCLDTLLEDGLKAKSAIEGGVCTKAVENIIEANTYLSGIGFESGGLAGAHAIHNGLTILEETHNLYHGEKVAFGTLVQLMLENSPSEEFDEIVLFCKELGLPTTLSELNISNVAYDDLLKVGEVCCSEDDTMGNMPFDVTPKDVANAIIATDNYCKLFN